MNSKLFPLITSQLKILSRDSLLLFLVVYPLILTFIGRGLIPIISSSLVGIGIDLSEHYPALMVFFVIMNPIIFGAIMGLMLLDERENNTIQAIQVLPINFYQYILSKGFLFTVLSVISGMIITKSIGLYTVPLLSSFAINLVASMGVLFGMLLINLFATNKVEGFATLKATGLLLVVPVISFYIPYPFNYLAAFAPAFWPSVAIATYSEHFSLTVNVWLFLLIGAVYISLLSFVMYRIVKRKMVGS